MIGSSFWLFIVKVRKSFSDEGDAKHGEEEGEETHELIV
jgi:hypothetical protein